MVDRQSLVFLADWLLGSSGLFLCEFALSAARKVLSSLATQNQLKASINQDKYYLSVTPFIN